MKNNEYQSKRAQQNERKIDDHSTDMYESYRVGLHAIV